MTNFEDHHLRGSSGMANLRPELRGMKVIGVEEHIAFPALNNRVPRDDHFVHVFSSISNRPNVIYGKSRISQKGEERIADMDEGGLAMQVLSSTGTLNSTQLNGNDSEIVVQLAKELNDELKKVVDSNPTRFKAFAELPFHESEEAVRELHRCVKQLGFVGAMLFGTVGGVFLDDPRFDNILSAFEELDVPLFLHPGVPAKVVWDEYYNIPGKPGVSGALGSAGWGWHNEVAIHVLRLCLSGTLDRHPHLKVIVGHQGEMLPMMMQRFDTIFDAGTYELKRTVSETLRQQVWISISGLYSLPPTIAAIATWGVDKVLFSTDYPFINIQGAPGYIRALGDLFSPSDLRKICQTNAEELLKFKAD